MFEIKLEIFTDAKGKEWIIKDTNTVMPHYKPVRRMIDPAMRANKKNIDWEAEVLFIDERTHTVMFEHGAFVKKLVFSHYNEKTDRYWVRKRGNHWYYSSNCFCCN